MYTHPFQYAHTWKRQFYNYNDCDHLLKKTNNCLQSKVEDSKHENERNMVYMYIKQ